MGDRIVRVEALIEQLVRRVGDQSNASTARTDSTALSENDPSEYDGPNTAFSNPGSSHGVEAARVLTVREPPTVCQSMFTRALEQPLTHRSWT